MSQVPVKSRVLNVNDDEASRYAVSRILRQSGYDVLEAATGRAAVDATVGHLPDLVVLDVELPDMSGMEVCRLLKTNERTRAIPILHLTAHALATEHKVQSINAGADAYLGYPVEPAYLLATVASLLKLRRIELEREEALAREKSKTELLEKILADLNNEKNLREQFLATLTHDLRSPLSSIKMGAQLVQRRINDSDLVAKQVARIVANCDRQDALIQNLLDASLYRAGGVLNVHRDHCDLGAALEGLVEELTSLHGSRFEIDISGKLVGAWDCPGLMRVFDNLVQNAIKYGSEVDPVRIVGRESGDAVTVEVINQGNPIPPAELQTLFEPYRRGLTAGHTGKKGWGLGLTLVKAIVEAHGGNVSVGSNAEAGTTFTVILPCRRELLPVAAASN
jgi:signal transduction histidine kinase